MDTGFFNQKKTSFNSIDDDSGHENSVRYPPKSNPPTGFSGIQGIREQFNKKNASMMPNLEDFNQMFRQYAEGLLNTKRFCISSRSSSIQPRKVIFPSKRIK